MYNNKIILKSQMPASISECISYSTRCIFISPLEILGDLVLLSILSEESQEKFIWIKSNEINYFTVNENIFQLNNDKMLIPDSFRRNGKLHVFIRWTNSKLEFKVVHGDCVYFAKNKEEYNNLKSEYDWFEFREYDEKFNFIEITPTMIRYHSHEDCRVINKDILVYSKL